MIPSDSQISLFSSATGASDLSIFEQQLPQEPRRFCVDLAEPYQGSGIVDRRWTTPRSNGSYDFTVHPRAKSPSLREGSPLKANAPIYKCPERDELEDEHFALCTERAFFRHQRLSQFNPSRLFPALVNPQYLPSFKRAADDLKRRTEEAFAPLSLPSLAPKQKAKETVKMTYSAVRHCQEARPRKPKKSKQDLVPFIPGGNRNKSIPRFVSLVPLQDEYDAAAEATKEESRHKRSLRIGGAFLPSCAKPKRRELGPLSFCRSQLASTTPVSWGFRPKAQSSLQEMLNEGIPTAETESPGQALPEHEPAEMSTDAATESSPSRRGRLQSTKSNASEEPAPVPDQHATHTRGSRGSASIFLLKTESEESLPQDNPANSAIPIFAKVVDEASLHFQALKSDAKDKEENDRSAQITAQFWKIADEGKVHHDDVQKALACLGFVNPKPEWIDEAFHNITKYVSMGLDEFLRFMKDFEALQRAYYKKEFEQCDSDGSGSVECGELKSLMEKLGILPMEHVLNQVVAEVDDNGNGELDFGEFEAVMDILRRREGFSKEEYDEISALFRRFDHDESGTMDTKEVHIALRWLGFSFKDEDADAIIKEIDEDESGQIDEQEWFVCMRKVRETKIKKLQEVIDENDEDRDGTIQYSELQSLLRSLGYVPDFDAVFEAAEAAGILPDDESLDLAELWRLLAVYREREGLNQEDLEQVESAFSKYAKMEGDGSEEEIGILGIGKMVRSIGYVIDFELQQSLTSKVDIDGSGQLDRREFRKMVRMIHEKDIDLFREAFEEATQAEWSQIKKKIFRHSIAAENPKGGETLPVRHALRALETVSCTDSPAILESFFSKEAVADSRVDFYEFCQAGIRSRRNAREAFRRNGGFTEQQILELREVFNRYDIDGGGSLSGNESIKLFETEFPSISSDPHKRVELVRLMKEADEDGSNTLDFGDFLRIMRQLHDIQDELRVGKELDAVTRTKFTPPEVQEFRELFLDAGGGMKELGFPEVKELLKYIIPMGTKNVEDLRRKFDEQSANQTEGLHGENDGLDFPEFLWFMRSLLDSNFANMSDKIDSIVGDIATSATASANAQSQSHTRELQSKAC